MADRAGAPQTLEPSRENTSWRASFGKVLPYAIAFLTILAGWQIAAWIFPAFLIPSPLQVMTRLGREVGRESFRTTVARTFLRLAVGFSLACALGLVVGLASALQDHAFQNDVGRTASGLARKGLSFEILERFDDAPVVIARDKGFFAAEGLDAQVTSFTSGPTLVKGLVSDQLEVGVLGFTNAVTWSAQGADLKIIGKVQEGYHSLIARNDRGIEYMHITHSELLR